MAAAKFAPPRYLSLHILYILVLAAHFAALTLRYLLLQTFARLFLFLQTLPKTAHAHTTGNRGHKHSVVKKIVEEY